MYNDDSLTFTYTIQHNTLYNGICYKLFFNLKILTIFLGKV